ncbi:hypothetical protein, conserved [Angomonas deanei]|uniref:Uncharacterized protein n=2 Tax=Angomonas deanei TaxID=59799 RepID=A0A7G2CIQ9_9TRYP|nr:hypothetical protein, conserved [Angomonas deanei]
MTTNLLLVSLTVLVVLLTSGVFVADAAGKDCTTARKCSPWGNASCLRKNPMDLRFMLDVSPENNYKYGDATYTYATYGFCPNVDELQAFSLNGAGLLAAGRTVSGKYYLGDNVSRRFLRVYGFGNLDSPLFPSDTNSSAAVLVAVNGSTLCGDLQSVAVVDTLILEVGLYRGHFNYFDVSTSKTVQINNPDFDIIKCYSTTSSVAPSSDSSGSSSSSSGEAAPKTNYCDEYLYTTEVTTVTAPAKTGFVATCSYNDKLGEDECMFDSDDTHVCVGDGDGKKNCAKCIYSANAADLFNYPIQIWTSYFGSDRKKHTLLSGGSNPMYYQNFAKKDMLNNIATQLNETWTSSNNDSIFDKPSWWPW